LASPLPMLISLYQPAGPVAGEGQAADQVDRPLPGETSCLSPCWTVLDLFMVGEGDRNQDEREGDGQA